MCTVTLDPAPGLLTLLLLQVPHCHAGPAPPPKRNPFAWQSLPIPPRAPGNQHLLSVLVGLPVLDILRIRNHTARGLLYPPASPPVPRFSHDVAGLYSIPLSRLNNIPLFGRTPFFLSICQLMDHWFVSTFWLLGIMHLEVTMWTHGIHMVYSRNCWVLREF